jgi:GTPase SAR1 family protein
LIFYETSAKTGEGVNDLFSSLAEEIEKKINERK